MEVEKTAGWLDRYAGPVNPRVKVPAGEPVQECNCRHFGSPGSLGEHITLPQRT